jgi:hypothetical protein
MKDTQTKAFGGFIPQITYSYLSGNYMASDIVAYDLPEISSSGFYESFDNFIGCFDRSGWDRCYYVVKDEGVFCGNYSGDVMLSLVKMYKGGGLLALKKALVSSDLFFNTAHGYVSTNGDGGLTSSGNAIYSRFEKYDSIKQDKVDSMLDRLNEWSNGKIDESLDKTSAILKGLIGDE